MISSVPRGQASPLSPALRRKETSSGPTLVRPRLSSPPAANHSAVPPAGRTQKPNIVALERWRNMPATNDRLKLASTAGDWLPAASPRFRLTEPPARPMAANPESRQPWPALPPVWEGPAFAGDEALDPTRGISWDVTGDSGKDRQQGWAGGPSPPSNAFLYHLSAAPSRSLQPSPAPWPFCYPHSFRLSSGLLLALPSFPIVPVHSCPLVAAMHFSTLLPAAGLARIAVAGYSVQDDYLQGDFFSKFSYFDVGPRVLVLCARLTDLGW